MELTFNIAVIVLYVLSNVYLGYRFMMLGCHSHPEGAMRVRKKFWIGVTFFLVMSIVMIFRFSVWFAIPIILVLIIPISISLYFIIQDSIFEWKEKRKPIDRTE